MLSHPSAPHHRRIVQLFVAVLAVVCLHVPDAVAVTRSCGQVGFEPRTDNGAFEIRATRVSCKLARAVARGSRHHGPSGTAGATFFYKARGFRCWGREADTALPSVEYKCRRHNARVTFDKG